MQAQKTDLLAEITNYYSSKLALHGETPQGVDWNGEKSQTLRFEQLSKIIQTKEIFSINDLGCGYGAFFDFLNETQQVLSYTGIDISEDMIAAAKLRYANINNADFIISNQPAEIADFSVASGIFNVRLERSTAEWLSYIEDTLNILDSYSRRGFAFNCLTSYSDLDKMKNHLYYADPCVIFDICKRRFSSNITLLHDYGLYEFTILVRKIL